MWLSTLRLERFGAFRNWSLEGLTPGLNLLYGPNESGKTTLLMFLRAMLFGFPARQKTPYDPLDGAEPGGTLQVTDSQGQTWMVERRGRGRKARVTVSGGGASHDEAKLRELLYHLSEPVYRNIFAFGLKELQELDTLKEREVKHLLYSASMGLQGISLKQVEDELRKEQDNLFTSKGTAKEINRILEKLQKERKTIGALEQQPQEYQALQADRQQAVEDIRRLAQEEQAAAGDVHRLEKMRQAWDVWQERHQLQAELGRLPVVEQFPEDGLRRWEDWKKELNDVNDQLEQLAGDLRELRQAPPAPVDAGVLEVADAIQDLGDERKLFQQKTEEEKGLAADRAAAQSRLEQSLTILGPPWDVPRLEAFNPPLPWKAALPQWPQRLEAAAAAARRAEEQAGSWRDTLTQEEAGDDEVRRAGPLAGGWFLLGGFAALGVILALAAGGVFFLHQPAVAAMLGTGAGMAWLAALVHLVHLRTSHRRRLRELAAAMEQTRQAGTAAAEAAARARRGLQETQAEWRRFLGQWDLNSDLSPYAVLEILAEVGRAKGHLQALQEVRRTAQAASDYLDGFLARLTPILVRLGRSPATREDVNHALEGLNAERTAALQALARRQQWEQDLINLEKQWSGWTGKSQRLQGELHDLLAAAGVADEEAFRRRAALFQRRQELQEKSGQLTAQLQLLTGGPAALRQLHADLEHTTLADLEDHLRQAQARRQELGARLAAAQQQQGIIQERLSRLERADDLSQALLAEQELAAQLRAAAHRWTVAALARHFLEQGRRRFEEESQPQVLQRASRYFALLTEDRYRQVMATLEGETFLVINRQGSHVAVDHLSRGAAEQLYLALRFALVQEYSQGERNLPLILDDILVNFDHRRARQAVGLLQEMSRSHQLLLFTCHPHVLTLVAETLGPAAPAPIMLEGSIS